jgi:phthiodiolone/phenolphthiodiolone dimycocerosates ketoreductase
MSSNVRFGTLGQIYPSARQSLRVAALAEKQGWDFLGYPDQMGSTHPEGVVPDSVAPSPTDVAVTGGLANRWFGPLPLMGATAMATNTIELQCQVIDPLRRSPSVFAQEAVTIDHLTEGRASFCIGSGEDKQFAPFGERRTKPAERMREAVRVMNALWDSPCAPISRDSVFWPLTDAVFPLPLYRDRKPQVLIVGGGLAIHELAGELCAGWYTYLPGSGDPEAIRATVTTIRSSAERAGRNPDDLRFGALLLLSLAENDEIAWGFARTPPLAWASCWTSGIQSGQTWKQWGFEHPFGSEASWPKNMKVGTAVSLDLINSLPARVPDVVTERTIIWGGPQRVSERIQPYLDAGITEVTFLNMVSWSDPAYGSHFAKHASQVIALLGGKPLNVGV